MKLAGCENVKHECYSRGPGKPGGGINPAENFILAGPR
jgi:hypothetical protein